MYSLLILLGPKQLLLTETELVLTIIRYILMSFSLSMAVIRKLFSFPFSRVILGHSLVLRTTRKLPWVRITTKTHYHLSIGNRMNATVIKDLL